MIPWNKGLKVGNKWLGKKHKFTSIEKMRKSHIGKKQSKETIAKRVTKNTGKKRSDKVRRKMSLAHESKGGYQNHLWHNRQRRIKKLGNGGFHSLFEWENLKAQYNWTCPCCHREETEVVLSEDHIIPISKGGSDNIENIQPLCRNCNSKKYNKVIKYEN